MNRDKTGPEGKGPRTGRGKGSCKRAPTKWNLHVMEYKKAHPNMIFKDVLKNAAKTYTK